jgi:hypothetical protein
MEPLIVLAGLAFLANKAVSTLKYALTPARRGDAFTQVVVWAFAIGTIVLASLAEVTETLVIPGTHDALGNLDLPSLILVGLMAGASGSTVYDFRKAIDNTDTANEPSLLPPGSP